MIFIIKNYKKTKSNGLLNHNFNDAKYEYDIYHKF